MEVVSVADLKKELTPQDYMTLTLGDDANAERAIEKARLWTTGKVLSTGSAFDESTEVIRTILLIRSIYELFSFVGYSERAKSKEADATDLLESYFGTIKTKADRDGAASECGPAGGSVKVMEIPRYGS